MKQLGYKTILLFINTVMQHIFTGTAIITKAFKELLIYTKINLQFLLSVSIQGYINIISMLYILLFLLFMIINMIE